MRTIMFIVKSLLLCNIIKHNVRPGSLNIIYIFTKEEHTEQNMEVCKCIHGAYTSLIKYMRLCFKKKKYILHELI